MERWGSRTTAQKLGIAKNSRVFVIDPPSGYVRAIGELPEGACFEEESAEGCAVSPVVRPRHRRNFTPRCRACARSQLAAACGFLWRKSKQDGLNGNIIRAGAIDVGLVDYKICSINETWSAMVFAIKKADSYALLQLPPQQPAFRLRAAALERRAITRRASSRRSSSSSKCPRTASSK